MNILQIIEKKKLKQSLTNDEISFVIEGYSSKKILDYQMSALLMIIWCNGMNDRETYFWTKALVDSGITLNLKQFKNVVDKHSTGGVGDKVSIALGPILACANINVAKMAGKGLGITGGTIDKLNSIPGFNTDISVNEALKILKTEQLFIMSQTDELTPADALIYNLRNASNTVDSIPLIAASVMSKKIAINSDLIYLDVKVGNGAFCKSISEATALSKLMIKIGKQFNKKVVISISSMEQPLGKFIGNSLEILEAIQFLNNEIDNDFTRLVKHEATQIISLVHKKSKVDSLKIINEILNTKKALKKFNSWISTQGGDINYLNKNNLCSAKYKLEIKTKTNGYLKIKSCYKFGEASLLLGAGRTTINSNIDYLAGIELHKKHGDKVETLDTLFTLYSSNPIKTDVVDLLNSAFTIQVDKTKPIKLIIKTF